MVGSGRPTFECYRPGIATPATGSAVPAPVTTNTVNCASCQVPSSQRTSTDASGWSGPAEDPRTGVGDVPRAVQGRQRSGD